MKALGIDTSNYTCSVAAYDSDTKTVVMKKQLLPTPEGSVGLRQSQALFEHVRLLGGRMTELCEEIDYSFDCIGVSTRPRDVEGSYMPCFLAGSMAAQSLSAALKIPMRSFSHQQGHIAAALYSAGKLDWLLGDLHTFFAFHLSGGTTECLQVKALEGKILEINRVGKTLDLNAGQVVDRIGVKLGLSFPAGSVLEKLAENCSQDTVKKFRATIPDKGCDCCLSGLENICQKQISEGKSPAEVARFCIWYVTLTIDNMLKNVFKLYGKAPVLFAGGVSGNKFLQEYFKERYDGVFAKPEYSSDNAAGVAILACLEEGNALL